MKTIKPKGYGHLTNIIRLQRVYMTTHMEGEGTEGSPMRQVCTFFDKDGEFLGRFDSFKSPNEGKGV